MVLNNVNIHYKHYSLRVIYIIITSPFISTYISLRISHLKQVFIILVITPITWPYRTTHFVIYGYVIAHVLLHKNHIFKYIFLCSITWFILVVVGFKCFFVYLEHFFFAFKNGGIFALFAFLQAFSVDQFHVLLVGLGI